MSYSISAGWCAILLLLGSATLTATPFELQVTYSNPQIFPSHPGFGLPIDSATGLPVVPDSVTSHFLLRESVFNRALNEDGNLWIGGDDITKSGVEFGDGAWRELAYFYLLLRPVSDGFDFLDLTYQFSQISTNTTAWGIVQNHAFQLSVFGQDWNGTGFYLHYVDSQQSLLPVSVPDGGSVLEFVAAGMLLLLCAGRKLHLRPAEQVVDWTTCPARRALSAIRR